MDNTHTHTLSEKITSGSALENCKIDTKEREREREHLREHRTCPRMQLNSMISADHTHIKRQFTLELQPIV